MPVARGGWRIDASARPAVEAYKRGDVLRPDEVAAVRIYLRGWLERGHWTGPSIVELHRGLDGLTDQAHIDAWVKRARYVGIDPL